jgi:hypothetical protein
MAKRRGTRKKTSKVKRGKVSRKTMKRTRGRKKSSSKSKSRSKAKKVSNILSSTYGLGNLYKVNEKRYKGQRVAKKSKKKPPPIPSNIKGKKKKQSKTLTLSSSSQSAKDSFLAGITSKPSKGNWISHVKEVWKEGVKSNPEYKYKDAMKDAKKTW